jgi:hypothetical protein
MDNKTFAIGILSLTAVVLVVANLFTGRLAPHSAMAQEVVRDRGYVMVTAEAPGGSDALYIMDERTGLIACLLWDPSKRSLEVRDVQALTPAADTRDDRDRR